MATSAGHLEGADREQFLKSIHGKNAFEGAAAGTAEMDELVSLAGSAHQLAARLSSELATPRGTATLLPAAAATAVLAAAAAP